MVDSRSDRRDLLPLARTQLKLVVIVCLPIVLACVTVTSLQLYFFVTSMRRDMSFEDEFSRGFVPTTIGIAVITLCVLVPTFIAITIWVTHRIVGPMRRLAGRLDRIAEGKIGEGFHFRDGDDLAFVGDALARMEASIRQRIQACKSAESEAEIREKLAEFVLSPPPEANVAAEGDQDPA